MHGQHLDEAAIERIGAGLLDRTLPSQEWTHAAHFAATLWLMRRRPELPAQMHMPRLIRAYNEASGRANTATAGYHETITLASLRAARSRLAAEPADRPLGEIVAGLMASPLGQADWLLAYWSRPKLFSRPARLGWLEPDLAALPFPPLTMDASITLRLAERADIPLIEPLMRAAIDALLGAFLSPRQVAASHEIMGLDRQLIADRTYYVAESDGRIVGCGGWSRRATLFGGDHTAGRDPALLDPAREPARVRAMYTAPDWTRRGVGRLILARCEADAAAAGFAACELAATLAGEPLYRAGGYLPIEGFEAATSSGDTVPLVRMRKTIALA